MGSGVRFVFLLSAVVMVVAGCIPRVLVPPTRVSGTHRVCVALALGPEVPTEFAAELNDAAHEVVHEELMTRFQGLETKQVGVIATSGLDVASVFAAQGDRLTVVEHCDELLGIGLGGRDEIGRCSSLGGAPVEMRSASRECEHFAFQLQLRVTTTTGRALVDRRRQGDQWQITNDDDSKQQKGPREFATAFAADQLRPMVREALKTYSPAKTQGLTVSELGTQSHALAGELLAEVRLTKPRPRWMREEDVDLRNALAGALVRWDDLQMREGAIGDTRKYRSTREGETYKGSLPEMKRFATALVDLVTALKEVQRRARAEEIARPMRPRIRELAEAGRQAEAYDKFRDASRQYLLAEEGWGRVRAVYLAEGFSVPDEVPSDLATPADAAVRGRIRCEHVLFAVPPAAGAPPAVPPAEPVWPEIPGGAPWGLKGFPALEALARLGAEHVPDHAPSTPQVEAAEPGTLHGRCVGSGGKKCDRNHQITTSWNARKGNIDSGKGTYEINLAVPVEQTIDVYCDGRRRGSLLVSGSTKFDLSCE